MLGERSTTEIHRQEDSKGVPKLKSDANAGGRIVYKERGGVIACVATMGVIAGSNVPMFLGAMLVGPSAAWLMMKVDGLWEGKIKPGFEMLVNMFSAGILGAVLSVGAFFGIAPFVTQVSSVLPPPMSIRVTGSGGKGMAWDTA